LLFAHSCLWYFPSCCYSFSCSRIFSSFLKHVLPWSHDGRRSIQCDYNPHRAPCIATGARTMQPVAQIALPTRFPLGPSETCVGSRAPCSAGLLKRVRHTSSGAPDPPIPAAPLAPCGPDAILRGVAIALISRSRSTASEAIPRGIRIRISSVPTEPRCLGQSKPAGTRHPL
jgi:hypothetical protein